jgi:zinc protease
MKRLAALSLLFAACAQSWQSIPRPPLRAFEPQEPRRIALPNGMVIFLQEDRELPLVSGFALVRGGSLHEPAEKAGLVSIYGQAWRTGGTKQRSGDALDDYLEARAAKVETMGSDHMTTISWSCLKEDFDEVFVAFNELLRTPEFREDKILLAKKQLFTEISRRNDSAGEIAGREAGKLAYGASSPIARVPEYATVGAVTREDLLAWHAAHVHPNQILLGVSGDFDAAAMEAKLRAAFEAWPKGKEPEKVQVAISEPKPGVFFVPKDDVNQSEIRMVHLGVTRRNPDFFAITVMNEVFGGGMSARLFSNVRTRKGLAYRVHGYVGAGYDEPGMVQLSMGTKSGSTAAAITALLEEIDNLQKNPPTPEELARAKDVFLNSFIFRLDSKAKVLRERLVYEFYGYPADFMQRLRAGIEKVTIEDVARVARKYIHKDQLRILVVGNPARFDRPLSTFGTVTTVDITIPEPRASAGGS